MSMTESILGREGNVLISSIRKYAKAGYAPQSGPILLSALSCDVVKSKTDSTSQKLNGLRGPGKAVATATERAGAQPFEFIPGQWGWLHLMRCAFYYWNSGSDKAGGGGSDLDGAVSAGDTSITLTDGTGYATGDYIQIDTGTHTTEVCLISDDAASPTFTLTDPLNFDHDDATVCNEVEAPFTHNFKFNNAAQLESITLDKYLGDAFGIRYDGSFINTFSMTSAVDGLLTGNVDIIAAASKKITASSSIADSGTTSNTTATKLVEAGQNFETTVSVGMLVKNTSDNTYAYVTEVDSDTTLSLDNDIMTTGETYVIYENPFYLTDSEIAALKPSTETNYIFAESDITINGAAPSGDIIETTFTVNNNLSPGKAKGSGDNLSRVTTQGGEITFDFNAVYVDSTYYDLYEDETEFPIVETYDNDTIITGTETYSITLTIPKAKIKTAPHPLTPEEQQLAVSCTCQYDTATSSYFIIAVKDDTYQIPYVNS